MKKLESLGVSNRLALIIAALVLVVIVLLVFAVRQPTPTVMFDPTSVARPDSAHAGAYMFTADARDESRWHHFSFAQKRLVAPGDDWDISFRRFHVIANATPAFTGGAGVRDLGKIAFASVTGAPKGGYTGTIAGRDTASAALARWYGYSMTTHLLTSIDHVYAVRTGRGEYYKMQVVSYYCPGPLPGCLTIRFAPLPSR